MKIIAWIFIVGSLLSLAIAFPFLWLVVLGVVGLGLLMRHQEE